MHDVKRPSSCKESLLTILSCMLLSKLFNGVHQPTLKINLDFVTSKFVSRSWEHFSKFGTWNVDPLFALEKVLLVCKM